MTNDKYWYRLLTHFYNKNYFKNGLTLPFIIGSRTIIEPDKQIHSVIEFLEEIKNTNTYLSVLKCTHIGEYVFSISQKSDFDIYGGFNNIVDIDGNIKDKISFAEFSKLLDEEYSEKIKQSLFSKNKFGDWESYTDYEDIPKLRELKKKNITK